MLLNFNPRAPCGARHLDDLVKYKTVKISIHAPRAGRDNSAMQFRPDDYISIHAPRAGRDFIAERTGFKPAAHFNPRAPCGARRETDPKHTETQKFQSTRPVRGATLPAYGH